MARRCKYNVGVGYTKAVCAFCETEHYVESLGHEAISLAYIARVELDEWQKVDLVEAMRVDSYGRWVYTTVAICISRQNGKGEILQARELYGITRLAERILHTAHEVKTAKRAFQRAELVSKRSSIDDYVERYRYANGEEALECGDDPESEDTPGLFYRARTNSSGRGLDAINVVVWDEAQELTSEQMAASSSTTAVSEYQQKWLLGSGGMATSEVWHGMREDALIACGGGTGRIVSVRGRSLWIEYTAEVITVVEGEEDEPPYLDIVQPDRTDRANWALANPAYPHRVGDEFMESELLLFKTDPPKFDREHLGCWDARKRSGGRQSKLPAAAWAVVADEDSTIASGHVLAVSVGWEQLRASVVAAGRRSDGARHLEVLWDEEGTAWLEVYLRAKIKKNRPKYVAYHSGGPTRAVKAMLTRVCKELRVELVAVVRSDYVAGCEALVKSVEDVTVRHLGAKDTVTSSALKRSGVTMVGAKWMWESETLEPVSVLEGITIGAWVAETIPVKVSSYESDDDGDFDGEFDDFDDDDDDDW